MDSKIIALVAFALLFSGCASLNNLINGIDQKKVRDCQQVSFEGEYIEEYFNEEVQGNCLIRVAKEEGNPNYCEFISETAREKDYSEPAMVYYDYHKDKCYYEMAVKLNDKTLCEKISEKSNDYTKDYCYSHFEFN